MRQEIRTVIRMLAASDPTVTSAELSALENARKELRAVLDGK